MIVKILECTKGFRDVTNSAQKPQKNGNDKILTNFGKSVPLKQFCFLGNVTVGVQGNNI